MALTAQDVVTKTRKYISDDNPDEVFIDAVYITALNRAQLRMKRDRPELMVSATGITETYAAATVVTSPLLWPDDFVEALAQYSAYDILSDDTHDRANREEAEYRLDKYKQEISV